MTYEESLYVPRPDGGRESLPPEWTAYGGLVDGGIIVSLGNGFSLVPGLDVGVCRIENEMAFSLPILEEALSPEWKGALYDWETLASTVRAHWPAAQRLGTQLVLKLVVNCHHA